MQGTHDLVNHALVAERETGAEVVGDDGGLRLDIDVLIAPGCDVSRHQRCDDGDDEREDRRYEAKGQRFSCDRQIAKWSHRIGD